MVKPVETAKGWTEGEVRRVLGGERGSAVEISTFTVVLVGAMARRRVMEQCGNA